MTRRLASIRRYPVKALGGEPLSRARVTEHGIEGDRVHVIAEPDGRWLSGKNTKRMRRNDALFELRARTGADGRVRIVDGDEEWDTADPGIDEHLRRRLGTDAVLLHDPGARFHDAAPVSLVGTATLAHCADRYDIDADPRRLRTNLVVTTSEPFEEEGWIDRPVCIGDVELVVTARVTRCRMIDLAQDGATGRGPWLAPLGRDRDAKAAVYARVVRDGSVREGDVVVV
ncbi:MOSC domain-containing protein [Pseudoclavibacter chungangensis]|uniref:MOSC domain-containing protein n=1 Tax=Pseudoclavibacter chungangensis TaxID=587635 RepID=A0A7J5BMH5_9MICO|nr:MOSC N-terminal beta barrel domain-containing protein [Pseudoclavibacter chungangensis]KAB1652626.1 MOSC domain-containing protein [Pseudoclavibacter chungangensis]NYJ68372.1 hypothetical protein [Pseudoclavibacter chungangensis]